MGYLPAAMRNYLVRLGWAHGDQEIFSTEEMIAAFDLPAIGRSPARFDFAKLESLNAHYMRSTSDADLVTAMEQILSFVAGGNELASKMTPALRAQLIAAMPGLKERAKTLVELFEASRYVWASRPLALDEAAKTVLSPQALEVLSPILRRLEATVPALTVLRNPRNMGKGYSIRNGILNSRGRYIIFTDIDMAYSKSNLLSVLEKLEGGSPVVVGNRRLPESVYVVNNALVKYVYRRHRGGIAFNRLVRLLFGLTTHDTQSGLKGFSRNAAARIFQQLYTDGFLFDIEIFIRSRTLGIPVVEVPVQLTYEDDITTVQQFRYLFAVIPELMRIKTLEMRGAYEPRGLGTVRETDDHYHRSSLVSSPVTDHRGNEAPRKS